MVCNQIGKSSVTTARRSNAELRFQQSLTACGLALPPVAFITWPTNQPSACRLRLRLRDLVGIGGDDLVDGLLDRAECR